ncbi:hypothetical protein GCM10010923_04010 [Blastomonas marina]|uniref:Secreted protein n=1 Tax=Blastomonas marina TaxID=1867408 RepID=A0ABQ1F4C5_9SPHN|nr:hypothetical protein GCM10010923_04010 [Blastomonas marina]
MTTSLGDSSVALAALVVGAVDRGAASAVACAQAASGRVTEARAARERRRRIIILGNCKRLRPRPWNRYRASARVGAALHGRIVLPACFVSFS